MDEESGKSDRLSSWQRLKQFGIDLVDAAVPYIKLSLRYIREEGKGLKQGWILFSVIAVGLVIATWRIKDALDARSREKESSPFALNISDTEAWRQLEGATNRIETLEQSNEDLRNENWSLQERITTLEAQTPQNNLVSDDMDIVTSAANRIGRKFHLLGQIKVFITVWDSSDRPSALLGARLKGIFEHSGATVVYTAGGIVHENVRGVLPTGVHVRCKEPPNKLMMDALEQLFLEIDQTPQISVTETLNPDISMSIWP